MAFSPTQVLSQPIFILFDSVGSDEIYIFYLFKFKYDFSLQNMPYLHNRYKSAEQNSSR